LVVKKVASKHFPDVFTMTSGLSAVLNAGGSTLRKNELSSWDGLSVSTGKLQTYSNRFATSLLSLDYLGSLPGGYEGTDYDLQGSTGGVLLAVKNWLSRGTTVGHQQHHGQEVADQLARVQEVYENDERLFQGMVFLELLRPMLRLIPDASAHVNRLSKDLVAQLRKVRNTWQLYTEEPVDDFIGNVEPLIKSAYDHFHADFEEAVDASGTSERDRVERQAAAVLRQAAATAAKQFDKHIGLEGALAQKMLLDPRNSPVEYKGPIRSTSIQEFFKCLPSHANAELVAEYKAYCELWRGFTDEQKNIDMREHWLKLQKEGGYELLSDLSLWYAEVQASSISAERCFGIMRGMEDHKRFSMAEDMFKAELFIRCNTWLLNEVKKEAVKYALPLITGTLTLK
jgi:hypothetical protein